MNLSPHEWCRCFEQSDRPCAAVRRRLTGDLVGKYVRYIINYKLGYFDATVSHN